MRKAFFAIEGTDGVGKTSTMLAIKKAAPDLLAHFKSPPDDLSAIRNFFEDKGVSVSSRFFYYISGNTHLSRLIREELQRTPVCIDRFMLSTIASHNVLSGVRDRYTKFFEIYLELDGVLPDLTIMLSVNEAERMARIGARQKSVNNRKDLDSKFGTAVQEEMLRLASNGDYPSNTTIIDTSKIDLACTVRLILELIENKLRCLYVEPKK